jgi:transposase-like protein
LTKTITTQKVVFLEKADNNLEEIAQRDGSLQLEQEEENVVDCPDCFDTMIKIYESDKSRYRCENCELIIGEHGWL